MFYIVDIVLIAINIFFFITTGSPWSLASAAFVFGMMVAMLIGDLS